MNFEQQVSDEEQSLNDNVKYSNEDDITSYMEEHFDGSEYDGEDFVDDLYSREMQYLRNKEAYLEFIRNEKLVNELREVRNPAILSRSKDIHRSVDDLLEHGLRQKEKLEAKRQIKEYEEAVRCTHHPMINKYSVFLIQRQKRFQKQQEKLANNRNPDSNPNQYQSSRFSHANFSHTAGIFTDPSNSEGSMSSNHPTPMATPNRSDISEETPASIERNLVSRLYDNWKREKDLMPPLRRAAIDTWEKRQLDEVKNLTFKPKISKASVALTRIGSIFGRLHMQTTAARQAAIMEVQAAKKLKSEAKNYNKTLKSSSIQRNNKSKDPLKTSNKNSSLEQTSTSLAGRVNLLHVKDSSIAQFLTALSIEHRGDINFFQASSLGGADTEQVVGDACTSSEIASPLLRRGVSPFGGSPSRLSVAEASNPFGLSSRLNHPFSPPSRGVSISGFYNSLPSPTINPPYSHNDFLSVPIPNVNHSAVSGTSNHFFNPQHQQLQQTQYPTVSLHSKRTNAFNSLDNTATSNFNLSNVDNNAYNNFNTTPSQPLHFGRSTSLSPPALNSPPHTNIEILPSNSSLNKIRPSLAIPSLISTQNFSLHQSQQQYQFHQSSSQSALPSSNIMENFFNVNNLPPMSPGSTPLAVNNHFSTVNNSALLSNYFSSYNSNINNSLSFNNTMMDSAFNYNNNSSDNTGVVVLSNDPFSPVLGPSADPSSVRSVNNNSNNFVIRDNSYQLDSLGGPVRKGRNSFGNLSNDRYSLGKNNQKQQNNLATHGDASLQWDSPSILQYENRQKNLFSQEHLFSQNNLSQRDKYVTDLPVSNNRVFSMQADKLLTSSSPTLIKRSISDQKIDSQSGILLSPVSSPQRHSTAQSASGGGVLKGDKSRSVQRRRTLTFAVDSGMEMKDDSTTQLLMGSHIFEKNAFYNEKLMLKVEPSTNISFTQQLLPHEVINQQTTNQESYQNIDESSKDYLDDTSISPLHSSVISANSNSDSHKRRNSRHHEVEINYSPRNKKDKFENNSNENERKFILSTQPHNVQCYESSPHKDYEQNDVRDRDYSLDSRATIMFNRDHNSDSGTEIVNEESSSNNNSPLNQFRNEHINNGKTIEFGKFANALLNDQNEIESNNFLDDEVAEFMRENEKMMIGAQISHLLPTQYNTKKNEKKILNLKEQTELTGNSEETANQKPLTVSSSQSHQSVLESFSNSVQSFSTVSKCVARDVVIKALLEEKLHDQPKVSNELQEKKKLDDIVFHNML